MTDKKQIVDGFDGLTINSEFIEWVEMLTTGQPRVVAYPRKINVQPSSIKVVQ